MSLYSELLEWATERLGDQRAVEVRVGLSYVGVLTDRGNLGLAAVLRDMMAPGCQVLDRAGSLEGDVLSLAGMIESDSPVEASLGLAAVNCSGRYEDAEAGDVLDFLVPGPEEKIGMVGYFGPLVHKLRDYNLTIFELNPARSPQCKPAAEALTFLPDMDLAIITATAIVNHTMEPLLQACGNAREVAVLGPSTPMIPGVWARHGVTFLGGTRPIDTEAILRIVSQGGGTRLIHKVAQKVNIRISGPE